MRLWLQCLSLTRLQCKRKTFSEQVQKKSVIRDKIQWRGLIYFNKSNWSKLNLNNQWNIIYSQINSKSRHNIYNTVVFKAMSGILFERTKTKAKNIDRKTDKQDYWGMIVWISSKTVLIWNCLVISSFIFSTYLIFDTKTIYICIIRNPHDQ